VFNQVSLEVNRDTNGAQDPYVAHSAIQGNFYFTPSAAAIAVGAPFSAPVLPQADGLFTEQDMQRVQAIIARDKLVTMPAFSVERPDPAVPAALRKLVGIWASDIGYQNGHGRHAMVIVTSVAAPAQATGFFVWGSPTPQGPQFPAGFDAFEGKVTGAQLSFASDRGYTVRLTASGDGFALDQTKDNQQLKLALKPIWRLAAAEQSGQARATPAPSASNVSDVTRFDGLWKVDVVCDKAGNAAGWSRTFLGKVQNGSFHGEYEPNSNSFDGTVKGDGAIQLTHSGINDSGPSSLDPSTPGAKFAFPYIGHLDGSQGRALRVEGRTCRLTLVKQ
jgi:hypothetical protein